MFFRVKFLYIHVCVFFYFLVLKCYLSHIFVILAEFLEVTWATILCVIVFGIAIFLLNGHVYV